IVYVASGTSYASREYVESLYKLISKLELRDQFILNFKYLDTFEIEAVFKASDIVALPYIHASQSGVMMMAFGFKRPVVLSDVFYDKKWISKKAGLVFQSKDVDDFARKLNILLSDSSLAKKYGDYGYKYSKRELNWSKIAHEYYETYKHLLQ
ncbi:MAG: glycosyltransferase, partial [Candidatus Paceibacterota bacterium]